MNSEKTIGDFKQEFHCLTLDSSLGQAISRMKETGLFQGVIQGDRGITLGSVTLEDLEKCKTKSNTLSESSHLSDCLQYLPPLLEMNEQQLSNPNHLSNVVKWFKSLNANSVVVKHDDKPLAIWIISGQKGGEIKKTISFTGTLYYSQLPGGSQTPEYIITCKLCKTPNALSMTFNPDDRPYCCSSQPYEHRILP
jgi:hypothetical protein